MWKVGNWVGGMAVREKKAGRTLAESKHALAILSGDCFYCWMDGIWVRVDKIRPLT